MAAARITALKNTKVNLGNNRLMFLFSKGVNARVKGGQIRFSNLPWFTAKMDFKGLSMKATQIMMVQTLMLEPVIQNMKRVIKICFDGDLANSQAF